MNPEPRAFGSFQDRKEIALNLPLVSREWKNGSTSEGPLGRPPRTYTTAIGYPRPRHGGSDQETTTGPGHNP